VIANLEVLQASTARPSGLSTRETNTLLKVLIDLAISSFGHDADASRTPTAGQIASELA